MIFTLSSLGDTPPYPTPSRGPKGALVFFWGASFRPALDAAGPFPLAPNLIETRPPAQRRVFLGSSVVEQPAVNRLVVGSNPTRGAILFKTLCTSAFAVRPTNLRNIYAIAWPTCGWTACATTFKLIDGLGGAARERGFSAPRPCEIRATPPRRTRDHYRRSIGQERPLDNRERGTSSTDGVAAPVRYSQAIQNRRASLRRSQYRR